MSPGPLLDVIDPATGRVLDRIRESTAEDVDIAVSAARAAVDAWHRQGPEQRAHLIAQGVKAALHEVEELAGLQCDEMGQPWQLALPLTEQALRSMQSAAEAAVGYAYRVRLAAGTEVVRVPRGVGALITPWNFPLPVALDGLVTLLCGGNTVVWKPSEHSPLSAARVAELLDLPPGVLTVVHGARSTGQHLAGHADVDIVVFTGSVEAGRDIARRAAARFCPVLLELGGKDPVVIDDDVDPLWAAHVVAHGAFWNSGQVCTSMERIYVHQAIAGPFVTALEDRARQLVVGPPRDPATQVGPLVDEAACRRVEIQLEDAVGQGAAVTVGGTRLPGAGHFFAPTVVTGVLPGMLVHDVETFGPVAAVTVVDSFHEGIALAASTDYGLCATLLTGSEEHAQLGESLPAAVCWVNEWQGGAPGAVYEPTRLSGQGAAGTLDTVTRPMMVHQAPLLTRSALDPA